MRRVVTFDVGQTLVGLDLDFLSRRLSERGLQLDARALADAAPAAWRHHDALVDAGVGHPWRELMAALLEGAGAGARVSELVEWLWTEQPANNLFRKPIPEMIALARELAASGVRLAVVSNSEGHLAQLLREIGIAELFEVIVDSGVLGIAKPDPRIFSHALDGLGEAGRTAIHIGDSWAADVEGALAAGWRAVWFRPQGGTPKRADPRVTLARDAAAVRAALG